jgi:hypothetical protein
MQTTAATQNKWLARYLTELDRWVPEKQRAAAEADVRGQVAAAVAMRPTGDDQSVLDALKELGAPQRFALNYGGGRSLIGPVLYPVFLRVLQVVLAIVLAVNLFGVFAALGWQQESLSVGTAISGVLASLFQSAGVIVVIFALVERFTHIEAGDLDKDWNPKSLPVAQDSDRIKVGETIFEIVFSIVTLVVLAFFLDNVGAIYVAGQGWSSIQIFTDHFRTFVPWLIALLAADTLLSIIVLARGYWQPLTRVLKIVLGIASLALLFAMLTGAPLLVFAPAEIGARITIAIIMVVTVFDIGKQALRIVRRPAAEDAPTMLPNH